MGGAKRDREGGEKEIHVKEWTGLATGIEVDLCTVAKSCSRERERERERKRQIEPGLLINFLG